MLEAQEQYAEAAELYLECSTAMIAAGMEACRGGREDICSHLNNAGLAYKRGAQYPEAERCYLESMRRLLAVDEMVSWSAVLSTAPAC